MFIPHSIRKTMLSLTVSILFIAVLNEGSGNDRKTDFYVTLPGKPNEKIYEEVDIGVDKPFHITCIASKTCGQLWIYAEFIDKPLVKMFETPPPRRGFIDQFYVDKAKGNMNATYEYTTSAMRIELDVFRATTELFEKNNYVCLCAFANFMSVMVINLHEPTKPNDMKILQVPAPPYLEGQKVTFSCAAEAWPTKTQFTINSNHEESCKKEVDNAEDGIECEVEIDYSKHGRLECVAENSIGKSTASFDMVIHVKARFYDCFDMQSEIGEEVSLVWNFALFPLAEDDADFVLYKDTNRLDIKNFKHELRFINSTAMFFNLTLPVKSENDYGNYTLRVTNEAGSAEYTLLLNQTVKPLLPYEIFYETISYGEADLKWYTRDEKIGGSVDTFEIKTYELQGGTSMDPIAVENTVEAVPGQRVYSLRLKDLQPLGFYRTQLRACSEDNVLCSDWSTSHNLNLSEVIIFSESRQEAVRASAVLISFFVVIAICALLLVVGAFVIARKKCAERKLKEQRMAARHADGYVPAYPSRTVMRIPPPSPGRSFSTLDWWKQSNPGANTISGYPFTSARVGDSFATFNGDGEDYGGEEEDIVPPLAVADDFGDNQQSTSFLTNNNRSVQPPMISRVSRTTGNI